MSNAFKCEVCGDFEEGEPNRRRYNRCSAAALTGWSRAETLERAELCDSCTTELDDLVAGFLGVGLDGDGGETDE